jgi:hypothetical protein
MTPEEQKAHDELKAQNEKISKEMEELKKLVPPQPNLPNMPSDPPKEKETLTLVEQVRKNSEDKKRIEEENKKISDAVKFNIGFERFASDNAAVVGDEIKGIMEASKNRKYGSDIEQANELRANILNSFFSKQANIDALVLDNYKKRAQDFLEMAHVKKDERSGDYWDLFELAVANIAKDNKHQEILKKESGQNTDNKSKEYDKKFFDMRSHYIKAKN